jgi:hypothetical protein
MDEGPWPTNSRTGDTRLPSAHELNSMSCDEIIRRLPKPIPRDGKFYRAWDRDHGAVEISYQEYHKDFTVTGSASAPEDKRIVRWQDEFGVWHDVD